MIKKSEISRGKEFTDIYLCSVPDVQVGNLEEQANRMFSDLGDDARHVQYERIFVSNPAFMDLVFKIRGRFYQNLGVEPPAASYVIAPPCNGADVAMVAIGVRPESDKKLEVRTLGEDFHNRARIVNYDGFEQIYVGNIAGIRDGRLVETWIPQLWQALGNLNEILKEKGFDFKRDMVRTWFSITDINKLRIGGRTNYMDFNEDVRTPFLDGYLKFKERYFASTGVGNGVCNDGIFAEIGAIAYKNNGLIKVKPMKNPLQTDVYEYTKCENPDKEKNKVRFERGMQVITPTVVLYLISGTASIRENKEVDGSLQVQTDITIENIQHLLEAYYGKLSDSIMAVTYVKPGQDAKIVESILNDKGVGPAQMPHLIVFDELCYRPLLVETELFAAVPLSEYNRRKANAT